MTRIRYHTDEHFRALKPVAQKQVDHPDNKERGLALRISPVGRRTWTFRYRNSEGKQCRVTLGTYPTQSLADARAKALAKRKDVQDGSDPAMAARTEKALARIRHIKTVDDLAADYFEAAPQGRHKANGRPKRQRTIDDERAYYDRLIKPRFGSVAVGAVARADVQRFLDEISDKSSSVAVQCRNVMRQLYNFAIRREAADKNPVQFAEVQRQQSRDRVLSDIELRAIWTATCDPAVLAKCSISPGMALAIRFAMATLQRGGEVCGLHAGELDIEARTWTIPGERTKNHRTHVVPLSDLAMRLLDEAFALSASRKGREAQPAAYAFPSPRGEKPVMRHALSRAAKRLTTATKIEDATPHDFRRTGSTHLTSERLAVPRFHVSCVLNHISDTGGAAAVTAVYDRNAYLAEKRRALDKWAMRLAEIVGEAEAPGKVVQLR